MSERILEVAGLRTYIATEFGMVRCVDGADLTLLRGETLGLVGESGCGKTMLARSVMGLVNDAPGIVEGRIQFYPNGSTPIDLTGGLMSGIRMIDRPETHMTVAKNMRRWRRQVQAIYRPLWGRHLSIIYQDPQTSLNPFWTVGEQLKEAVLLGHDEKPSVERVQGECLEWLERVHINFPERVLAAYAHELSGGMCQRVMIAIALASRPALVIADEPTTGLDVTIQARVVALFKELRRELGLSVLLISHDMGLIGQLSDRVAVMYCGRVVECGSREQIFEGRDDRHPYTAALLNSMPTLKTLRQGERLPVIEDSVPDPLSPPTGCAFHPRCPVLSRDRDTGPCDSLRPPTTNLGNGHWVRCWKLEGHGR